MQGNLTEDKIQQMHDYEQSDLTEREKMALRLADKLAFDHRGLDAPFMAHLKAQFSEEEIIDLGMASAFLFGWGRFIEAFGIVPDGWPDNWDETSPAPWDPTA